MTQYQFEDLVLACESFAIYIGRSRGMVASKCCDILYLADVLVCALATWPGQDEAKRDTAKATKWNKLVKAWTLPEGIADDFNKLATRAEKTKYINNVIQANGRGGYDLDTENAVIKDASHMPALSI